MNNREALKIIDEMIATAKADINDNGFFYLLWGWVILIGVVSQYIFLYEIQWEYHYIVWGICTSFGAIASIVYSYRTRHKAKVKTHFEKMMGYVWGGFGITLFLTLFSMNANNSPSGVYPLIIALYSMGSFISGGLLKFKPLKVGAIISWGLSLGAMFMDFKYQLLMLALSLIIAYLVPGYMLKSKYNKQHVQRS